MRLNEMATLSSACRQLQCWLGGAVGAIALHGLRAEHARLHEPRDAAPTHLPPRRAEGAVDARAPISLLVGGEERRDRSRQPPVLLRVRAHPAALPGVEAGGAHAIAAAERAPADARAHVRPLRRDEGERRAGRAEQNRMAYFRRSCSSLRSA